MTLKQLEDGSLVDIARANEEIITNAPKQGHALKHMARFQVGMPTHVRMQLGACGVTIDVLHAHLMNSRSAWKSFMTVVGLESIKGVTEAEAIERVAQMIMLSHECKLKLQELAKANQAAEPLSSAGLDYTSSEEVSVLLLVRELCKLLPPEVTDGVITNVVQET